MKKLKSINILYTFFILCFFPVFAYSQNVSKKPKQLWTISQVQEVAKKYNLQDSVILPRNAFLMYIDKKNMEFFLKEQNKNIQKDKEWAEYLEKTKNVHSFDDDVRLIESYPTVREAIVKMRGGEQGHKQYIAEARKYQWRIYRDSNGGLAFFRYDLPIIDREFQYGKRIDNLSQVKK